MVQIRKRDGRLQAFLLPKLVSRLEDLCQGVDRRFVHLEDLAETVERGLIQGVSSHELGYLTAETAASRTVQHPDYGLLAGRISALLIHKATRSVFSEAVHHMYYHHNSRLGKDQPLVSGQLYVSVMANKDRLDGAICHDRDLEFHYFGVKTLEESYLIRNSDRNFMERPQYLFMRVAVAIHGKDLDRVLESYEMMSTKRFIHNSSTLFNAGTPEGSLSPCFLLDMHDTLEDIFETVSTTARIFKSSGGIGINAHSIRAEGSHISTGGGRAKGLVPLMRVLNNTARYVQQGNKRPSSVAVYLEPWHADILEFLDLRKTHGKEEMRARDIFTALWIPDLFMRRVESNQDWTLFSPDETPGLQDCWGAKFDALYIKYEMENRGRRTVRAQSIWHAIVNAQIETGTPYMLYKDACNSKSNQQNLGCIKSSNLCAEIVQYSAADQIACCNLASIGLPSFVVRDASNIPCLDFQALHKAAQVVTRNLDRVIDITSYPAEAARRSNIWHRPVALGAQGLADIFHALGIAWTSEEAREINKKIFETIYHAALTASCAMAEEKGPYASYDDSPLSKGLLQMDMWDDVDLSDLWDWPALRQRAKRTGVRNSLLVGLMPTASTSQILGFNECIEPYTSNIYSRRTTAGEFQVVNKWLVAELAARGLWTPDVRNRLVAEYGSVQNIAAVPVELRERFLTVWEIPQRVVVEMAAARAPFVDQSQSLNIHMAAPTPSRITSMHFSGWKAGLKTGMYYLRTQAASAPIQFTVDTTTLDRTPPESSRLEKGKKKRKVTSGTWEHPPPDNNIDLEESENGGDGQIDGGKRVCGVVLDQDGCTSCSG